jgi:hypothetical protein
MLAVFCDLVSTPARSAEENGQTRFFLEMLPLDGVGHDWTAAGSRRIVTRDPDNTTGTLTFGAPDFEYTFPSNYLLCDDEGNVVLDLTNTVWIESSVVHITKDGVETVRSIYWLVTDEELTNVNASLSGLTAASGPHGDVALQSEVFLSSDASSNRYVSLGAGDPVRICVGQFQR